MSRWLLLRILKFGYLTFGFFLSALNLFPQSATPAPIEIKRLTGTIVLDGIPDEPAWQEVKPISFYVLQPVYGQPPSEKSELLMTYDPKYFYVAARLFYNDSTDIIARTYVRDGWRGDDWFAFDVDSRNDKQNAMRFALYPLGTHFDMAIANDAVELGSSTFNTNYNLIWEGKCKITHEGCSWRSEYSVTPQLMGDLTVNTDFSQAEVDDQQYNLSRKESPVLPVFEQQQVLVKYLYTFH